MGDTILCENGHLKDDDGLECLKCEEYEQEYSGS